MKFFLQDFLSFIPQNLVTDTKNFHNHFLSDITSNSKNVVSTSGFIAVHGVNVNGELFIESAIASGAVVIFLESACGELSQKHPETTFIRVTNARLINSLSCQFNYVDVLDKLSLLGVTGTNGKTTTAYLFYQIFAKLNQKSGIISTVECFDGVNFSASTQTTPAAEKLFPLLGACAVNNCRYVPMEVSSHALSQFRLGTLKFKYALFTNLTGDHLDYYENMENYYQAKKTFFLNHAETAIINLDDRWGERLCAELKSETDLKILTFSAKKQSDFMLEINSDENYSLFSLNGVKFKFNLLGEYNIYNLCGVLIALNEENYLLTEVAKIINDNEFTVPGRLELIRLAHGAKVFIDYAHTDDALANVLKSLQKITHKRIITVMGCGGDRDRTKRARMGEVAEQYSDYVIITSDNPRSENSLSIIDEIKQGMKNQEKFEIIENRAAAIKKSLAISENGDIVLIAGKGHENYQEIKGEKLYFSDREEVRKFEREK